jgi:hypothetical protein
MLGSGAPPLKSHLFEANGADCRTKSVRQSGISGRGRGYSPPIMPTIFQAPAASLP